jgi:hypothetical protein
MAGGAADSDGSPRLCILTLGLEEQEDLMASSPCREATVEKRDGEEGVEVKIGGEGELGRRSGRQGQELREATKAKTWCITREEKERERGRSFTDDELYQRLRKQRRRCW